MLLPKSLYSGLMWIVGIQGILNLQYLPNQFMDLLQTTATSLHATIQFAGFLYILLGVSVWAFGTGRIEPSI